MALFNNKLKFSKDIFKLDGNSLPKLRIKIKEHLTSKFAADTYLHLFAIILVSVFAALAVNRYVSSKIFIYRLNSDNAALTKSRSSALKKTGIELYASILKYNISDSSINGNLMSYSDSATAFASLDLNLIGTIKGDMNYAFFTDKSAGGKEIFAKQGDAVKLNYILYKVHSKYVIISNGAAKRTLRITGRNNPAAAKSAPVVPFQQAQGNSSPNGNNFEKAVKKTGPYSYEINRALINKKQLNSVFTQMQAIPNLVNGKIDGFKVMNVMPGGIFHYMGFNAGDVIESINGTPLKNPQEAVNLLSGLLYQKNISVDISRGGSNITLKYLINS